RLRLRKDRDRLTGRDPAQRENTGEAVDPLALDTIGQHARQLRLPIPAHAATLAASGDGVTTPGPGISGGKIMDLQLAGRRVLVTGASKGIGFAVAQAFAAEGAALHLAARTRADLERAAQSIS